MTTIRNYHSKDLKAVTAILNYYVKNDTCIFQVEPYTLSEIEKKFEHTLLNYPILVAEENDKVIGFTYGSRWRDRPAYAKSVETTIYIHPDYKQSGIGRPLYQKLLTTLTEMDFHLVVAGMALPNPGSQRLHEKLGFEKVGKFKEAGWKFGQWHSVGFWQKLLG